MATITSVNNPALHARLLSAMQGETVGWEVPSYVMIGGAQYRCIEMSDGTFEYVEVNSEVMHDSTSNFPGGQS